jgi:hypothetical protein
VDSISQLSTDVNDVFCLKERKREKRKLRKLINELRLILIKVYLLISVIFFSPSNETHPKFSEKGKISVNQIHILVGTWKMCLIITFGGGRDL